ncbi:zinc finger, CCHC-type containing protein [Tanacetum coccineum]
MLIPIRTNLDLDDDVSRRAIGRLKNLEEKNKRKGAYIPPHNESLPKSDKHARTEGNFSQDYNEAMKKARDFSNVKCYNCNEYEHYASHCHKRDQRQQRREASNLVEKS